MYVENADKLNMLIDVEKRQGKALKFNDNGKFKTELDCRMVGDSLSDLVFGKRLKMHTVHISDNCEEARQHPNRIDLRFASLLEFAKYMEYEKDRKVK